MDSLDNVPPVIRILMDEDIRDHRTPQEFASWWRKLVPELTRQAEWTVDVFDYRPEVKDQGGFVVAASGGLNPLSEREVCAHPECRTEGAQRLAQSIGLYSDGVILPDQVTSHVLRTKRLTKDANIRTQGYIAAVHELSPLIRAGVVQFRRPNGGYCKDHFAKFVRQLEGTREQILDVVASDLAYEMSGDTVVVRTGDLRDITDRFIIALSLDMKHALAKGAPVAAVVRPALARKIAASLDEALFDMQAAAQGRATLATSTRLDVLAIRAIDAEHAGRRGRTAVAAIPSLELPWISHLSGDEILRLREEASLALPRLREKLARAVTSKVRDDDTVAELRAEAEDVAAELAVVQKRRENRFRNVTGGVGLTMSVFGFASGLEPAAVALSGLMSLLALLHASSRRDEQDETKIVTKPGYVLFRARELLRERH